MNVSAEPIKPDYYLGLDFGQSQDFTAMAILERNRKPSRCPSFPGTNPARMEFPLTSSIRDDEHLAEGLKVLSRLVMADLDLKGSQVYLDALTDLVEKYEDENVLIPDAPAQDVLRLLMESSRLSQNKLAKKVGIPQSTFCSISFWRCGSPDARANFTAAAEEHRRQKPIFLATDAVTQHSHEPEESNTREGNDIQGEADPTPQGGVSEPGARLPRIGGHREPNEHRPAK